MINGISFSCLNVCGLSSKLDYLDQSNILESDIIVFTETKCDITSEATISKFFSDHDLETVFKHRKKLSTFKSGGIVICINKEL